MPKNKTGTEILCSVCGYRWRYKGQGWPMQNVSCPSCLKKINRLKNIIRKKNENQS